MLIKITDFAESRHADRDTVNAFIRNHPEIKIDTQRNGKNIVIDTDSAGYKLLDKQYPLPQLVQIIEDVESKNKLIKAQELIIQLNDQLAKQATLIAQAEATQILLEDKQAQIEELRERLAKSEENAENLRTQLDAEKHKKWWQKLTHKE